MKTSLTYIPLRLLPAIILVVFYALMQALALFPLVSFSFGPVFLKSFIDALILAGMGWLLSIIVPSSNYVKLGTYQRFINYFAIGVLFVVLWLSMELLTSWLLFRQTSVMEIRKLLPAAAFIGSLLYVIFAQMIHMQIIKKEGELDEDPSDPEQDEAATMPFPVSEKPRESELERVAVKIGQKIHVILVPDILYIQSDGDYVQIVTDQHAYMKEETMKYFETSLPQSRFVRVHRSYIVNVEKILRIELYEKQSQMLTLKNGDKIRASASGYKALRLALNL